MASTAKHIQIARSEGPEAGMEAYLSAPSSKIHPAFQEITRKRTPETRLAAYCKRFQEQIGQIARPKVTGAAEKHDDLVQQFTENLARMLGVTDSEPEVEDEPEQEPEVEDNPLIALLKSSGMDVEALAAALGNANGSTTPEVEVNYITSGEAWQALIDLGGDPNFPAPKNPENPATNGQLFRLNATHGVLSLNV